MATLSILSNLSLPVQGRTITGKQGAAADASTDALAITVDGYVHEIIFTLADNSKKTLYDDDDDHPATFDYGFFWADQDCFLQLIATATNVTFKIEATVPFWISGFGSLLAAANTTEIATGSDPSVTALDSIVCLNRSGTTLNGQLVIID